MYHVRYTEHIEISLTLQWHLISMIILVKISNQSENVYRSCKIVIANVHFAAIINIFEELIFELSLEDMSKTIILTLYTK